MGVRCGKRGVPGGLHGEMGLKHVADTWLAVFAGACWTLGYASPPGLWTGL